MVLNIGKLKGISDAYRKGLTSNKWLSALSLVVVSSAAIVARASSPASEVRVFFRATTYEISK